MRDSFQTFSISVRAKARGACSLEPPHGPRARLTHKPPPLTDMDGFSPNAPGLDGFYAITVLVFGDQLRLFKTPQNSPGHITPHLGLKIKNPLVKQKAKLSNAQALRWHSAKVFVQNLYFP